MNRGASAPRFHFRADTWHWPCHLSPPRGMMTRPARKTALHVVARAGPSLLAEKEGFEPSIRYNRIPDFESGAFDHSATSPEFFAVACAVLAGQALWRVKPSPRF